MTLDERAHVEQILAPIEEGAVFPLEAIRMLLPLCHSWLEDTHPLAFALRAVESETDHFPLGEFRELCAESYLRTADEEMRRYLEGTEQDIHALVRDVARAVRQAVATST